MVINMLNAVNGILHSVTPPRGHKVDCAIIILEEIIKGLEGKSGPVLLKVNEDVTPPKITVKTPEPPKEKSEKFMVTLNDDRSLKLIKGLSLDAKLLVDNKTKMTHQELIGKKFVKVQHIP